MPAAQEFVRHVGEIWLIVGIGALLFRTVHLFFLKDVQTGLVWLTKIITDPFNDVKIYYKAPLYLMRGELIDPMGEVRSRSPSSLKHFPEYAAPDGFVGELGCGSTTSRRAAFPRPPTGFGPRPRQSPHPCNSS